MHHKRPLVLKVHQYGVLLFVMLSSLLYSSYGLAKIADVRVVIDVSGSMKNNDPQNLRAPAVRLLIGLMPEGTASGIWTFGQYVNMQVKHGRVDRSWKALAVSESKKIHSRGLYTNIEEALKRASFNWHKPQAGSNRNIILLTDGMVDVSKDRQKNRASRQRILNEILPGLKQAGVRVHAIALSDNADKKLMNQLSGLTGGWYEEVDDADALERVFLKLFEISAPTPSLPIRKNRFSVDSEVNDMTVLVFREEGETVTLTNPGGKQFSHNQHTEAVVWYKEKNYELVTVKKPDVGDWLIGGSNDTDNRVMIVTNLKLATNTLPTTLLNSDAIPVEASLYEKDKKIIKSSFLNLVEFTVSENEQLLGLLNDTGTEGDNRKKDGTYSGLPLKGLPVGEHTIIVRALGATFERNIRHTMKSYDKLAQVKTDLSSDAKNFNIQFIPRVQLLDPESIHIKANIDEHNVEFSKDPGGVWSAEVDKENAGKTITVILEAKRHSGKPVSITLTENLTGHDGKENKTEENAEIEHEEKEPADKKNEVTEESDVEPKAEEINEHEEEEQTNWLLVSWVVLMVNIVLGIVGVLGFKMWKKKRDKMKDEETDEFDKVEEVVEIEETKNE
ncbi:MAG: VWA domain-containing protein [Gammaproteobacteria bacterium]|nr:VWA domain-containing protein [Gammaproteobacteria bacterium]